MNESKLRELCDLLIEIRRRFPDWRFGQLVSNMASSAGGTMRVWDVEDDELLAAANRFLERNRDRVPDAASPTPTLPDFSSLSPALRGEGRGEGSSVLGGYVLSESKPTEATATAAWAELAERQGQQSVGRTPLISFT